MMVLFKTGINKKSGSKDTTTLLNIKKAKTYYLKSLSFTLLFALAD
jgi:hypothetical protein